MRMDKPTYTKNKSKERLAKMLADGQLTEELARKMLAAASGSAPAQTPLLLDLRRSAKFVGFSETHFRKLCEEGVFPSVSFGKSRWFRVADLQTAVAKA